MRRVGLIETIKVQLRSPNNKQLTKLFQYANCSRLPQLGNSLESKRSINKDIKFLSDEFTKRICN